MISLGDSAAGLGTASSNTNGNRANAARGTHSITRSLARRTTSADTEGMREAAALLPARAGATVDDDVATGFFSAVRYNVRQGPVDTRDSDLSASQQVAALSSSTKDTNATGALQVLTLALLLYFILT
jgi:hypothetical protein